MVQARYDLQVPCEWRAASSTIRKRILKLVNVWLWLFSSLRKLYDPQEDTETANRVMSTRADKLPASSTIRKRILKQYFGKVCEFALFCRKLYDPQEDTETTML